MKKLLLIPLLFVLACSSSDDDSNSIENPATSKASISYSYDGQHYSESDTSYIHWEVERIDNEIKSQGFYGIVKCDNCEKSSTLKLYFDNADIKVGDVITDFSAYLTISDFGYFGYPDGDSFVKITNIGSDGAISGEFYLDDISRLGDGEPRTIDITNGKFIKLKEDY